jgi:hypothetical protein
VHPGPIALPLELSLRAGWACVPLTSTKTETSSASADGNANRAAFTVSRIQTHRRSATANSVVLPELLQHVKIPTATGKWNSRPTTGTQWLARRRVSPLEFLVRRHTLTNGLHQEFIRPQGIKRTNDPELTLVPGITTPKFAGHTETYGKMS